MSEERGRQPEASDGQLCTICKIRQWWTLTQSTALTLQPHQSSLPQSSSPQTMELTQTFPSCFDRIDDEAKKDKGKKRFGFARSLRKESAQTHRETLQMHRAVHLASLHRRFVTAVQ